MAPRSALTSRFAAAFGLGASAEDPKDDDKDKASKPKQEDGESDEDYAKRCEDEDKKKDAADPEKDKDAKGKNAEKDEDDDGEDDKEKSKASAYAAGFAAANERAAAVLSSKEANGKGLMACNLLFDQPELSAKTINGILAGIPAPKAGAGLARRMEETKAIEAPKPGGEAAAPGSTQSIVNAVIASAAKARGETPKAA